MVLCRISNCPDDLTRIIGSPPVGQGIRLDGRLAMLFRNAGAPSEADSFNLCGPAS